MCHRDAYPLAGQGTGHMQAKRARAGLYFGHAGTFMVQPIAGHHQVGAWTRERSHTVIRGTLEVVPSPQGLAGTSRGYGLSGNSKRRSASVRVSGSGSDQRGAACVGGSRERPAARSPSSRVTHTNSLTPSSTRPATR